MRRLIDWAIQRALSPPRCKYDLENTVQAVTDERGHIICRQSTPVTTETGLTLQGSTWAQCGTTPVSCVIYSHSHGSNQFEGLHLVPYLVTADLALFLFDYPASGMSDGDFIPFDGSGPRIISSIVTALRARHFSRFSIWGRSLGAAIALHAVSSSSAFCCCVADSAFASIGGVSIASLCHIRCPRAITAYLMRRIGRDALERRGFRFDAQFPIRDVAGAQTPLLMGHGGRDRIVPLSQAVQIFESYGGGEKQLYVFEGQHFRGRPYDWYENAARFVYRKMGIQERPRFFECVYGESVLHVGVAAQVFADLRIVQPVDDDVDL